MLHIHVPQCSKYEEGGPHRKYQNMGFQGSWAFYWETGKGGGEEFSSFWHVCFSIDKKRAVQRYISLNVTLICNAKVQMSQLADHQFWYLHVHLLYVGWKWPFFLSHVFNIDKTLTGLSEPSQYKYPITVMPCHI